jgi:hypothetical protein
VLQPVRKEFGKLVNDCKNTVPGKPLDGAGGIKLLLRYRFRSDKHWSFYRRYLELYKVLLPKEVVEPVFDVLTKTGLYSADDSFYDSITQETVNDRSKKLTIFVLRYRERFSPYWKYMQDISYALPWNELDDSGISEIKSRVIDDFGGKLETSDSEEYRIKYSAYSRAWLSAGDFTGFKNHPSLDTFISTPFMWGTAGASIESGIDYLEDGVIKKSKKVKYAQTLKYSPAEIKQKIRDVSTFEVRMSIKGKEKAPKTRTISKVGLEPYILESYLAIYVEQRRRMGSGLSTFASPLHMTQSQYLDTTYKWIGALDNGAATLDMDAAAFDVNYSKFEDLDFYYMILDVAKRENWPNLSDIQFCVDKIVALVNRGYRIELTTHGDKIHIPYVHGLISGKRTTALQGTCKSSVVLNMAIDDSDSRSDVVSVVTQGDDSNTIMRNRSAIERVYSSILETQAIKVNAQKTLVSPIDNVPVSEFLKQVYSPVPKAGFNRSGIPIRSLSSIMARSPESNDEKQTPLSVVSNWIKAYQRGLDKQQVCKHMASDISGMMGCSLIVTKNFLTTPKTVGGAGLQYWYPFENTMFISFNVVTKKLWHTLSFQKTGLWSAWGISNEVLADQLGPTLGARTVSKTSITMASRLWKVYRLTGSETDYHCHAKPEYLSMYGILLEDILYKTKKNPAARAASLQSLLEPKSFEKYRAMLGRWSSAALDLWLRGRLFTPFSNPNYSMNQIAVALEPYYKRAFTQMFSMRSNRAVVSSFSATIEAMQDVVMRDTPYRYGD